MAETPQNSSLPITSLLERGKITLLVVEDDKFLRDLLVGKLTREGYKIVEAHDGREGISEAKKSQPHLILLDLIMPGIDGFGVLEAVKKDPDTTKIPVVILSNLGSQEDIDRAMALGAKEFLVKAQHTPQEIVNTIKKVLDEMYLKK